MGLPTIADWKNDHLAESEASKSKSTLKLQFSILGIPTIWVLALASLSNYVTRYAINSWGPLYLQEARGFDEIMSGTMLMISTPRASRARCFMVLSATNSSTRAAAGEPLFAVVEIIGLLIFFFGPNNVPTMIVGMVLFGLGLTGLVTSLGGLFAVDICPKRVAGAAMGVIGVFSYIGAALQENISGLMIEHNSYMEGADRIYDFGPVIWFWIGSSVVSALLAASLWRAKLRD